jgi:predicted DsbA family dithiol-disulfide isomerase
VLCVWAYFAQLRIDAVERTYADQVQFETRFCSVFGDTARKIATGWASKGGYEGFNAHLMQVGARFPEMTLNPNIWLTVRPATSVAPQLLLKSIQLAEAAGEIEAGGLTRAALLMRKAFFEDGLDIADRDVRHQVLEKAGLDLAVVTRRIKDGRAHAALSTDYKDAEAMGIQGSPTFVLNEGRQKLFGNVGFRIIDANIQELLRDPSPDQASWC